MAKAKENQGTRTDLNVLTNSSKSHDQLMAKMWIIKNQLARRNLQPFVALELLEELRKIIEDEARKRQRCGQGGVLLEQTFAQASEVQPDPMKNKTFISAI